MITHTEYMANSRELHHAYHLQFATEATFQFVERVIGLEALEKSTDPYFNDIIKNVGTGGWVWDRAPYNLQAMYDAGEVKGYSPSMATITCVGKAAARELLSRRQKGA